MSLFNDNFMKIVHNENSNGIYFIKIKENIGKKNEIISTPFILTPELRKALIILNEHYSEGFEVFQARH